MMLGARTVAQTFCLALGIPLVLAGIVGFFVDSSFTAGEAPPGDLLLGLEVNGWHNIAHIATGAVLLLGAPKARTAITALMIFAMGYVVVTAWGFIDGESVFRLLAINEADRWFHVFLTLAAFIGIALSGGLAAPGSEEDAQARRT
jgi:Domain of unknown function (DUF4383)